MVTVFDYTKFFIETSSCENWFLDWSLWIQQLDILYRIWLIKDIAELYPSHFFKKTSYLNSEYLVFNFELLNIHYYIPILESGFISNLFSFLVSNYSYQVIPVIKIDNFYYVSNIAITLLKWTACLLGFLLFVLCNSMHLRYLDMKKNAGTVLIFLHTAGSITSEEEIGGYDDALFFMCIFTFLIGWWCFFSLVSWTIYDHSFDWLLYGAMLILFIPFTFLITLFYFWGLFICTYIRGTLPNWWGFVALTKDCINIVLMSGRFITQNVRFLIILDALFDVYQHEEFLIDTSHIYTNTITCNWERNFLDDGVYLDEGIEDAMVWMPIFAYNFCDQMLHLSEMTVTQAILYLVLCYWLFSLVYCGQFNNRQEKYFLVKAEENIIRVMNSLHQKNNFLFQTINNWLS